MRNKPSPLFWIYLAIGIVVLLPFIAEFVTWVAGLFDYKVTSWAETKIYVGSLVGLIIFGARYLYEYINTKRSTQVKKSIESDASDP